MNTQAKPLAINSKQISRDVKHREHLDVDAKIFEESKGEEDEMKNKEYKEKVINQEEIAFLERLKERLNNKDKFSLDKAQNNEGIQNLKRLSNTIPNLINRVNTLPIKKDILTRKLSMVQNLSKMETLRPLPVVVRQASLVKEIEDIRKKNMILLSQENEALKINSFIKNEEERQNGQNDHLAQLVQFLDSTPTIIIMSLATLFALFGDDIKSISLPVTYDFGFDVGKAICMGLFLIEIILSCIAKKGYVFSFFFWLDLVSTLSLFQDIDFIINPLVYGSLTKYYYHHYLF